MEEPGNLKLRANVSIRMSGYKLSWDSKTAEQISKESGRSKIKSNFCKIELEGFIEGNTWCD